MPMMFLMCLCHVAVNRNNNPVASPDESWLSRNQSRGHKASESARRIRSDVNSFQVWLFTSIHRDNRPMKKIPAGELDLYLTQFFSTIKTRSGADYDPNSLSSLRSCLERHLKEEGYPFAISCSPEFRESQAAFKTKKSLLKRASVITAGDVIVLRQCHLLGPFTPRSLLNVLFWRLSHFTILKSKADHYNLLWGDVELSQSEDGSEHLVLTANASRTLLRPVSFLKTLTPDSFQIVPECPDDPDLCPVQMYKEYQRHRPASALRPLASFYLRPLVDIDSDIWYMSVSLGLPDIGSLIRDMKGAAGLLPSPNISARRYQDQHDINPKTREQFERKRFRAIQTRSYVNKFEKWAQKEPRFDDRRLEDMPPEVLDPYLVEFLSTVTSSRTGAIGVNSLIALRSGLERHLKEVKYPYSITSSAAFAHSQLAYKARKAELQTNSIGNSVLDCSSQSDDILPTDLLSSAILSPR